MLVAPIVDDGATSRTVHVPPGDWVSLSESLSLTGELAFTSPQPGSLVPSGPVDVIGNVRGSGTPASVSAGGRTGSLLAPAFYVTQVRGFHWDRDLRAALSDALGTRHAGGGLGRLLSFE